MCGFVGFYSEGTDPVSGKERALKMAECISHRGPDDIKAYSDGAFSFGFARLCIIDAKGSIQPMVSRCGRYVLCFNGEIYNYRELRKELSLSGATFVTEGDTEVLLCALITYGEDALKRLRGMFSFAFYDKVKKALLLARDPFGIKPLYYAAFDGAFAFTSEIKAFWTDRKFDKRFNGDVLPYYLQFQYVPTEETAFAGVKRLLPGHTLKFQDGNISVQRYFYPPVYFKDGYLPFDYFCERDGIKRTVKPYVKSLRNAVGDIKKAVLNSVRAHLVADVEVGAFLSGGVDSGYLSAVARPKHTFTVGFSSYGFDEREYAAEASEDIGAVFTAVEADADDFFESVDAVEYHCDEPYANLSAVPLYILSQKTKKKVSCVISGEGADELFGGYEWYFDSRVGKLYRRLPLGIRRKLSTVTADGRISEFLRRNSGDARVDYIGQARITDAVGAAALLKAPYKRIAEPHELTGGIYNDVTGATLLKSKLYLDRALWLPFDILLKADKMTMASALELRVPYLDLEVLKVAQGLSDRLLVRKKIGKYAFRCAAAEAVGKKIAMRRKKGFPVPLREWIREAKYAKKLELAFTGAIGREFFETDVLLGLLRDHVSGRSNNARILYTVYAFIRWYDVYFGEGRVKGSENEKDCGHNFRV